MSDKDYQLLYYKYKTKYLNLKKELFGGKNSKLSVHLEEYTRNNFQNEDEDWMQNFTNWMQETKNIGPDIKISKEDFEDKLKEFNNSNDKVVTISLYNRYRDHNENRLNKGKIDQNTFLMIIPLARFLQNINVDNKTILDMNQLNNKIEVASTLEELYALNDEVNALKKNTYLSDEQKAYH